MRGGEQQFVRVLLPCQRGRIHGSDQQSHARHVEHGVRERHGVQQCGAGLRGGEFVIRNENRGAHAGVDEVVHRAEAGVHHLALHDLALPVLGPRDGHAAVYRGRHVVGMPFEVGRVLEDHVAVELALVRERVGGGDAGHDRLGGRAHAARLRDVVVRLHDEPAFAQAKARTCAAERGDHQVRLVARQRVLAFAGDENLCRHVERIGTERELELVMVIQGKSHGVETGAEIGAGRRHANVDFTSHRIHFPLPTLTVRAIRIAGLCITDYQSSTRMIDGSPVTESSWHTASTASRSVVSSVICVTRRSCWISPS